MSDHNINILLLLLAAITGAAEIAIFWMILQDYRKARGKPELSLPNKRWALMGLLSLGPLLALLGIWLFSTNLRRGMVVNTFFPEDNQENSAELSYGWKRADAKAKALGSCFVTANGSRFLDWSDKYRLAFACFNWDGQGDPQDATDILFSKPYDISNGDLPMAVYWDNDFASSVPAGKYVYINFALLMVPNGVDIEKAKSLRQAAAMGARRVWRGSNGGIS
jgi:hypothetical protein